MRSKNSVSDDFDVRRLLAVPIASVILSVILLLILESVSPYFFLKDDNLNWAMPIHLESGRQLLAGKNPFISETLFGGEYKLYADPAFLGGFLHPLVIFAGTISELTVRHLSMDLIGGVLIALAAFSFALLFGMLQDRGYIRISAPRLLFLSLAYAFTGFNLVVGANWCVFLGWQSGLCFAFAALLVRKDLASILLLALALLHGVLASHLQPTFFVAPILLLWALLLSYIKKSFRPLIRLVLAGTIALLAYLPLLFPAYVSMSNTYRFGGAGDAGAFNLASNFLAQTLLLGPFNFLASTASVWKLKPEHWQSIAFSAGSWIACVAALAAFVKRERRPLFWMFLAGLGTMALVVVRPQWLTGGMALLPLLRSVRWPFREVFLLNFFLYGVAAIAQNYLNRAVFLALGLSGSGLLIASFAIYGAPSFDYGSDSPEWRMVTSGRGYALWQSVKIKLRPDELIFPATNATLPEEARWRGYDLIAGFNYPAYFGIRSASGYSVTKPINRDFTGNEPYGHSGVVTDPNNLAHALEVFPNLTVVSYEGLNCEHLLFRRADGSSFSVPIVDDADRMLSPELALIAPDLFMGTLLHSHSAGPVRRVSIEKKAGLVVSAPGALRFRVPPEAKRLTGTVGVLSLFDSAKSSGSGARFEILGILENGSPVRLQELIVSEATLANPNALLEFDLSLERGKFLELDILTNARSSEKAVPNTPLVLDVRFFNTP